jgi:hypothetical protein
MKKKLILMLLSLLAVAAMLTGCLEDDRDGDGLPNSIEEDGWPITIILLGEINKTQIHVTSDPDKYDTDNDGLSDWEEYMTYQTNPRRKDTDYDTLTDWEEIKIHGSDPTDAFHDIDKDSFWDWEEILYFRKEGYNDDTIRSFMNNTDIDRDGTIDGYDKYPLLDAKINLTLNFINITGLDTDGSPQTWEIYFTISIDSESFNTDNLQIPRETNYSLDLSWSLNLSDEGKPGFPANLIAISVWDEQPPQPVKINNATGWWGVDDFDITTDSMPYYLKGDDGSFGFTIENTSRMWKT